MVEYKDAHVVEIPTDDEGHRKNPIAAAATVEKTVSSICHHPLAEISQSPGHLLLLKLWQREEDLFGRRISRKESRKEAVGGEIFQMCCFFFLFHGLFSTILFTSFSTTGDRRCGRWWIPCVLSACTSSVIVFLVHCKLCRYREMDRQLQRDRAESRALTRCIQELRMKGASFDLGKEPQNGKKLKSSSVEIKWRLLAWYSQYRVTVFLVCFAGLVLPFCRFVLCAK